MTNIPTVLDIETIRRLERSGFLRSSLEDYLRYHATYKIELEASGGKIEQALTATSEKCYADQRTIRRAVNKVSILLMC